MVLRRRWYKVQGEGKCKFFPLHAMKAYWRSRGIAPVIPRMEVDFPPHPTTLPPPPPSGKEPGYFGQKNLSLLPGLQAQTVQAVAQFYTQYATMTCRIFKAYPNLKQLSN